MIKIIAKTLGLLGYVIQYGSISHCMFEYVGDFVVCNGPSMEPTLHSNDILLTNRIYPRLHRFNRGDLIIAKCPTNPLQHVCKRIIGLPGDKIISESSYRPENVNKFNKNDVNVSETKTLDIEGIENTLAMPTLIKNVIIVPRGHIWVEGDNHENSADSRFYGPVPQGLIKSVVICRIWPISNAKFLI